MLKTSKWYDSFGTDVDAYPDQAFKPLSADERHSLATHPLPIPAVLQRTGAHHLGAKCPSMDKERE